MSRSWKSQQTNTVKELRKRLDESGMQQKDLAAATGLSPSAVSQMLNGSLIISRPNAEKFADALGDAHAHWHMLLEKDLESDVPEPAENLCTNVPLGTGETLPLHHPTNYQQHPEAAARYMAELIARVLQTGALPEASSPHAARLETPAQTG